MYSCNICRQSFSTRDEYNSHISNHLQSKDWYLFRSAFSGATKIFRRELNIASFMELFLIKKSVQLLIEKELLLFPQLKLNISVNADYQLGNEDENPQIEEFVLKSENYIVSSSRKKERIMHILRCFNQLRNREDQINLNQSGWTLARILFIDVHLTQVNILLSILRYFSSYNT